MVNVHFIQPDSTRQSVEGSEGMTLMETAREAGIPGILAECGGGAICSTCHVHIAPEWIEKVGTAPEMEQMLLEFAPGKDESSRLSCQIVLTPELDGLTVTVPEEQSDY